MEVNQSEEPQIIAPPLLRSCRLQMSLLLMLGLFVGMFSTENTAFTIVCINQESNKSKDDVNISNDNDSIDEHDGQEDRIYWDKQTQGILISLGYIGVLFHFLIGYLSDKYGRNKLEMLVGVGVMSVISFISPVVITHLGTYYFFVLRLLIGIAMGLIVCPVLPILSQWSAPKEQGVLIGCTFTGFNIANIVINPVSSLLCHYGGWQSIFHFSGTISLLWLFICYFTVYDTPAGHPWVSVDEKQYLQSYASAKKNAESKVTIPWRRILTSVPVWSVVFTNFFFFAAMRGVKVNLPLFIMETLNTTITENGIFSAIPSVGALLLHLIVGPLFDYVRAKRTCSLTTIRKSFHLIGTLGPAAMMFAVVKIETDHKYLIIALITIGVSLTEATLMGGFSYALIDIAPEFVGILQGINNTIGLTTGFIVPVVVSALTPNEKAEEWDHVFVVFGSVFAIAALSFTLTGSAERQNWTVADNSQSTDKAKVKKEIV